LTLENLHKEEEKMNCEKIQQQILALVEKTFNAILENPALIDPEIREASYVFSVIGDVGGKEAALKNIAAWLRENKLELLRTRIEEGLILLGKNDAKTDLSHAYELLTGRPAPSYQDDQVGSLVASPIRSEARNELSSELEVQSLKLGKEGKPETLNSELGTQLRAEARNITDRSSEELTEAGAGTLADQEKAKRAEVRNLGNSSEETSIESAQVSLSDQSAKTRAEVREVDYAYLGAYGFVGAAMLGAAFYGNYAANRKVKTPVQEAVSPTAHSLILPVVDTTIYVTEQEFQEIVQKAFPAIGTVDTLHKRSK